MDVLDTIFAMTVSLLFSGALLMSVAAIFKRVIEEENKLAAALVCATLLVCAAAFMTWERW